MAGIDKTYIRTKEQYQEIYDWIMSLPIQKDDLGFEFDVKEWLPLEYTDDWKIIGPATPDYIAKQIEKNKQSIDTRLKNEKYWNENKQYCTECKTYEEWLKYVDEMFGEICLWNTPVWFDIFLIRNCPVGFIQDRLKFQYGDEYEKIKNQTGKYTDLPDNPGHSFKLPRRISRKASYFNVFVMNEDSQDLYFNNKAGKWVDQLHKMCNYDEFSLWYDTMSRRKLGRLIKKWKLQKGWIVEIIFTVGKKYNVINFKVN